jgi:bile acid-coenzyme A ligase
VPIGEILTQWAEAQPDHPAVTCFESRCSYGELESRANRLARAYAECGVDQGDIVVLALPNGIEFVQACYAVWKLGAVPLPVSAQLPTRELERITAVAQPRLIVGNAVAGRRCVPPGFEPDPAHDDASLEPRTSPAWKIVASGGSTGRPKLIVSGSDSGLDPDLTMSPFRVRRGQVQLIPGPFAHNASFLGVFGGTLLGQHVVVLPRFDAEQALTAISRHGVNYVCLVPTMMQRMLRVLDAQPGTFELGSLETLTHTAAPCPPWLKLRWIDLLGPERILEIYGGTESQSFTAITGTEWIAHPGSVGKPIVGEMRVAGPDGTTVGPGTVGRIMVRRSAAGSDDAYRYLGAETVRDADGWETLGDLGWSDAEGYLYLADRDADMLLVGGANVYPAEVEAVVLECPGVLSCVVVGLPDDDLGQRPHAIVQVDTETPPTAAQLREFVAQRLVRYKAPRSFRFVSEPLRNDAGKVNRAAVRDQEIRLGVGDGIA